jgi:hypothetical protein
LRVKRVAVVVSPLAGVRAASANRPNACTVRVGEGRGAVVGRFVGLAVALGVGAAVAVGVGAVVTTGVGLAVGSGVGDSVGDGVALGDGSAEGVPSSRLARTRATADVPQSAAETRNATTTSARPRDVREPTVIPLPAVQYAWPVRLLQVAAP